MTTATFETLLLTVGVENRHIDQAAADAIKAEVEHAHAAGSAIQAGPLLLERKLVTPAVLSRMHYQRERDYVICENCAAVLRVKNFRPDTTLSCPSCKTQAITITEPRVVVLAVVPSEEEGEPEISASTVADTSARPSRVTGRRSRARKQAPDAAEGYRKRVAQRETRKRRQLEKRTRMALKWSERILDDKVAQAAERLQPLYAEISAISKGLAVGGTSMMVADFERAEESLADVQLRATAALESAPFDENLRQQVLRDLLDSAGEVRNDIAMARQRLRDDEAKQQQRDQLAREAGDGRSAEQAASAQAPPAIGVAQSAAHAEAEANTAIYAQTHGEVATRSGKALAEDAADASDVESVRKPVIAAQEVIARLHSGRDVTAMRVPELDLSGQTFDKKVTLERCDVGLLNAEGAVFKKKTSLRGCRFDQRARFAGATFEHEGDFRSAYFHRGADFKRCDFAKKVSFNYAIFPQHATFKGATFRGKAVVSNIAFQRGVDLSDCTAKDEFSLSACEVGFRTDISGCVFEGLAMFSNTAFNDVVDFSRTKFKQEVRFFTTTLARPTKFMNTRFDGPLLMSQANIDDDANFNRATFNHEISFESTRSRGAVRLTGATLSERCQITLKNCQIEKLVIDFDEISGHLKNETEGKLAQASADYAFLKRNYQGLTEYDSEDRAYYQQRRLARIASKPRTPGGKALKFLEWTALDLACGYATKPINILWTSLILLLGFAASFYAANEVAAAVGGAKGALFAAGEAATFSPLSAIVFSFKTLTNAEVGAFAARPGSWIEYVVMIESALGFAVLMLLVSTFTRKVAR